MVEDKLIIEDALKITNVGGAYLAEAMEEQEINEVKDKNKELDQIEEEVAEA